MRLVTTALQFIFWYFYMLYQLATRKIEEEQRPRYMWIVIMIGLMLVMLCHFVLSRSRPDATVLEVAWLPLLAYVVFGFLTLNARAIDRENSTRAAAEAQLVRGLPGLAP